MDWAYWGGLLWVSAKAFFIYGTIGAIAGGMIWKIIEASHRSQRQAQPEKHQ